MTILSYSDDLKVIGDAILFRGDCLEVMKTLDSGSIDCVITSPPYNMNLRIRNGRYCSRQITKEISTKYTNYDDNLPMEEYFDFSKQVIIECLRISDLVFYNIQFLTGNKKALFNIIGEFSEYLKEFVIWNKVNAQPAIGRGVLNSQFEVILIFQKSNPISRSFSTASFGRGEVSNLWDIKRGAKVHKTHGATFPDELVNKILKNFTSEGSTVLDPFMGTGTAGAACMGLNRKFIGIELDEGYFKIATERIDSA